MRPTIHFPVRIVRGIRYLASFLVLGTTSCLAATTLSQQIDPPEVNVGDEITVTLTVHDGAASSIHLPNVDGLQIAGSGTKSQIYVDNGSISSAVSQIFILVPSRAGDFTIPPFDIVTRDGQTLHAQAMKVHVLANGTNPSPSYVPAPVQPPSGTPPNTPSNGPVIMPPNNTGTPPAQGNAADTGDSNVNVPIDSDGRPAKVFMVITPKTTDAYVGETIPLRIEFYIRFDVIAQQDSLPTIKGSDFLMNNLSVRPSEDEVSLMNAPYHRDTWITAISAPKNGDFPLQMVRDTYWTKPNPNNSPDPFGNFFFSRPNLAHGNVDSNELTFHVHALPEEGRPANFTGAIGQLTATGNSMPDSVAVGEPVTLHFTVSGEGNFDYVKCPSLAPDPVWKSYAPASKIQYQDESHTQGIKTFEQAVIPQKNGSLPLPAASFSYFDPTTKQYVTVPVSLPAVTVTGSPAPAASASPVAGDAASATTPATSDSGYTPNRVEIGFLQSSLLPVYHQPWFWAAQGGMVVFLFTGVLILFIRSRSRPDDTRTERALHLRTLHQEEDAMGEAVRNGDAHAFFMAARHAVQLQLGTQWRLKPEVITLGEIRSRDPQLAETLEPLFSQADEVIYSGQASGNLDLAQWELRVRKELLQHQPA